MSESEDVHRWADWMPARVERLYGLGESMGAADLLQSLAREPRFRSVVAECPFASLAEIARDRLSQATGVAPWLFTPVTKIGFGYARRCGVRDGNTPMRHSREIAAANPKWVRLWDVPGADHVNAPAVEPERYKREVLGWFDGR